MWAFTKIGRRVKKLNAKQQSSKKSGRATKGSTLISTDYDKSLTALLLCCFAALR
jgi:hypothetical protein